MDKRYSSNINLTKYDLSSELFDLYDVTVEDLSPLRNVYLLNTTTGNKILKRIESSKEELEYINSLLCYISSKFNRVIKFMKTKDGEIYANYNGEIYCIMELLEGRECDYNNPVDIAIASKGLAELHTASEGFKTSFSSKVNNGKSISTFIKRAEEMILYKKIAELHEIKTDFDSIFLLYVDSYIAEIRKSIEHLEESGYYKLASLEEKIVICHHDLAYHNIIIKDGNAYFVDFDYAVVDLRVHDLCNFINKVLKYSCYDIDKCRLILKEYFKVSSLSKAELSVLYGMLCFPDDFYNISRDYYTRRKDWSEEAFLSKLKKKVSMKEDRIEFLDTFKKLYC